MGLQKLGFLKKRISLSVIKIHARKNTQGEKEKRTAAKQYNSILLSY